MAAPAVPSPSFLTAFFPLFYNWHFIRTFTPIYKMNRYELAQIRLHFNLAAAQRRL